MADSLSTSFSLLALVKKKDAEAWVRLVELYGPIVYGWARHAGLQDSDACDIMQEAFRKASQAIERFRHDRPADTFRGWLWTITRNELHNWFQKRKSQPEAWGGADADRRFLELPDPAVTPSSSISERSRLLHRALELIRDEFSEQTWEAFRRTVLLDEAPAEVARDLDVKPGAIRQAKYRVLCRLRDLLTDL